MELMPPPASLLLREIRVLAELPRFMARSLFVGGMPRGDGHPVMVIPGFGAGDAESWPLRRALARLGYAPYGWGCGRNLGMRPEVKDALAALLARLHARHDAKVSLIGWSLGGVFVRELARKLPEHVRHVYTLGSPINGDPAANNMLPLFRLANRGKPVKLDREGFERRRLAPPVPCTAIYTKSDGIVAWRCAMENEAPNTENVEVQGSHFGLIVNLEVLRVIAERLARPM